MSSLFLFGAGASFGSGPCQPTTPPLGSALFDELRNSGGVAARVSDDLAALFRCDFEAGMDRFWLEHNPWTSELLRDMARFFAVFEPEEGNLYMEVIAALGGTRKKAVFATTNYDLLIEHAIVRSGFLITYGGLPVSPKNIPVLKIHGSCNFLPDMGTGGIKGISFDLSFAGAGAGILDAPIRAARSADEIQHFCATQDAIAPALAMYHSKKRVLYSSAFVKAQQDLFLASIKSASRIYLIGLRVHAIDEHIWQPLGQAKSPLFYVGREPVEFRNWAKDNSRKNAFVIAHSFAEALPIISLHHG
ncbi:hypothetical protein [Hydrocarboniphaga sp.]|uniref:hypothetical protein n=1 Tax=Hydrocarboniphaga sp. TaxID=2033016 RepID=UPI003D11CA55